MMKVTIRQYKDRRNLALWALLLNQKEDKEGIPESYSKPLKSNIELVAYAHYQNNKDRKDCTN